MKNEKKYNIGLDLGTGSVGWCVTDENNNIVKHNSKNMWGARIFEEAHTAETRRNFRSARRRADRRKERINILQSLLKDDMDKEYENFFPMLRNTYLVPEEKSFEYEMNGKKYNLFSDSNFTDENYYKKFPTIYHLRNYLVETTEKVDFRLVYLAIHHIIKYRGNFLHEGNFSNDNNSINESLIELMDFLKGKYDISLINDNEDIISILLNKNIKRQNKKQELIKMFDFDKEDKKVITNIVNAIFGYKFELSTIFDIEYDGKIDFSTEIVDEDSIIENLNEESSIYEILKSIYSWSVLQEILNYDDSANEGNKKYISKAFMKKYDNYADDLKYLKEFYRKYLPKSKYKEMFKIYDEKKNNYVAYNGKNKGESNKKCDRDALYSYIKNDINTVKESTDKKYIIDKMDDGDFLKKLNVTDNGAIPYQLHRDELFKIIENQEKYYKTLRENKTKIKDLLEFRIPYYVGPLEKNEENCNAWVVRKSNEKIRPWNFDDVVDKDATAEKFIRRMTNKCTYLINEDVMPKQSILYSKYCVLNELNNIKLEENRISKDTKKKVFCRLFLTKTKVSANDIKKLLAQDGLVIDNITGFTDESSKVFNSNMKSYIDLKNIIGDITEENIDDCEKMIYWITIFEDKSILKKKLKENFEYLSDKQINKISKLNYSGWSRLSKKLINGLKSYDKNETIMEKLENTNMNFMQIINKEEFGFKKQIEDLMPKPEKGIHYKDIEDIPTSPANKRAIWQAMLVVKEIVKVMKCEPQNIFIEFARNEGKKGEITKKRFNKIIDIYNEIDNIKKNDELYKELKSHQSDKEFSERLYLYFIQLGKSLYSGKPIEINRLSEYQVDHIIPRSYTKDDSIDNKALVYADENQRKADDLLLDSSIQRNMRSWWEYLLKNGLISPAKFNRLTKTKMFTNDDDRLKFVKRQLVETRQITKYVTNILNNNYKNTNVFSLRSNITHNFRNQYKIYKNRNVNDCHHAQDAYIMALTGNILNKEWKNINEFKYGKYVKDYMNDKNFSKNKNGIIVGFISKYVDAGKLRKVMEYKDFYISTMLMEQTGAFYKQTICSPKKHPTISLKNDLDTSKYGGYTNEFKAYCTIYKYLDKKKIERYRMIGIPVKIASDIKNNKITLQQYLEEYSKERNEVFVNIFKSKIMKYQEYLDENGNKMILKSDSEIKSNKQLILSLDMNELIYAINNDQADKEEYLNKYGDVFEFVYDKLAEKMHIEYPIFETNYKKIIESKNTFNELGLKDKKDTINGIINLLSGKEGNLKKIGLGDREGRIKNIKFEYNKLKNMIFVEKSVTGMYERRYKIDGLENSCCN